MVSQESPKASGRLWLAITSLLSSYGLLVSVVVVGAFWINREFESAQNERCSILRAEVNLTLLEVNIMIEAGKIEAPEPSEALKKEVRDLSEQIEGICPS